MRPYTLCFLLRELLGAGACVSLPVVIFPGHPLDALGHVAHCAEAGYECSFFRAENENVWVRAVEVVAERKP